MICECCGHEISDTAVFCPHCATQVEGALECTDYIYEAFISYRHQDADRAVAKRLQRYLEGFRIPRQLATGRTDKRLGKLFRDEDELPTSSSLTAQIEHALGRSRYLIVVCSPQSLGSQWVQREVELFCTLHGRSRVFLALVSGEPEDSFPPLLLHRVNVAPDGTQAMVDVEPLAADFRQDSGKTFKAEAARIAAGLIGCGYDDLQQRQRVRRIQTMAAAAAVVAAVSLAFGAFSLYQQNQIREEHRKAQIHESEMLAVEAERLLEAGDRYQAIQVALSALPESSESDDRPYVPAARLMLERAIGAYPSKGYWTPRFSLELTSDWPFASSEYGVFATVSGDEVVEVYDLGFGDSWICVSAESLLGDEASVGAPYSGMAFSDSGLACAFGNSVFCIDMEGNTVWRVDGSARVIDVVAGYDVVSVVYEPSESDATAQGDESAENAQVVMYDASNGQVLQTFDAGDVRFGDGRSAACSETGDVVALSAIYSGEVYLFDTEGNAHRIALSGKTVEHVCFGEDAWYILSGDGEYGEEYVEAFDFSGERMWVHEDSDSSRLDPGNNFVATNNKVIEAPDGTVLATFCTTLVKLDAKTGEQVNRTMFSNPVLDLAYIEPGYFAILSDGEMLEGSDLFSEWECYSEDVTTEELTEACILRWNGEGVFALGRSIAPGKITSFRIGDGFLADAACEDAPYPASGSTLYWEYGRPCAVSADGVSFLDGTTFEPLATVAKSDLALIDWAETPVVSFSDNDEAFVWGRAADDAAAIAIYRTSADGEILQEAVLPNALSVDSSSPYSDYEEDELAVNDDGTLLWSAEHRAVLLDQDTLATVREYPAQPNGTVDAAYCSADTVLLMERGSSSGTRGNLRLFDRATGEQLPGSDLDEYFYYAAPLAYSNARTAHYRFFVSDGHAAALSPDGKRVAISCADGATRVFRMDDGSMVWESFETPALATFMTFVPETNDMVMQDESGKCSLVSAEDGKVIASTMTPLPVIEKVLWMGEPAMGDLAMLVRYRDSGVMDVGGFAFICVSEKCFGPFIDMPEGVALDDDFDWLLVKDGHDFYRYPVVYFSEAIEVAEGLAQRRPLSETEAAYYQVDQ